MTGEVHRTREVFQMKTVQLQPHGPAAGQRHTFTVEHVDRESQVSLLSSRAPLPLAGTPAQVAAAVLDEGGSMDMQRSRITWEGRFRLDAPLADHLQAVVGWQDAASRQLSYSDLNARPDRELRP